MTQCSFSGDLLGLSDRQLKFIDDVIVEQGFKGAKVVFTPVGIAGDNYIANVKRITIESEDGPKSIIAKVAPTNPSQRIAINANVLFNNEHLMYTMVLPKFTELQRRADVPEKDMLRYAKCYGSICEEPNEIILLEDLTTSHFEMLKRQESLSDACVKSVLRNFGVYHSLSYVLKREEPETFEFIRSNLIDMWSLPTMRGAMTVYFQQIEEDILTILDDEESKSIVRHKLSEVLNMASKLGNADAGTKYTVIQQGDAWTNNIMFRFQDERTPDSIMIDYQLSKESSPACDILYMIFNCTDYDTQAKYFQEWIQYYHSELSRSLDYFGLKVNFIYPLDKLEADLKRYGKMFFSFALLMANVLTMKSEDAAKVKESMQDVNFEEVKESPFKITDLDNESIARFKSRVTGLIASFKEFGLL